MRPTKRRVIGSLNLNMKTTIAVIISLVLGSIVAFSNQEEPVSFSKLRYESENGRSGRIVVEATQDEKAGIIALKVSAFEKEYALTRDQLADISGAQWNGMRVIYDGGILGETIWIRVEVATSTGTRDEALIRVSSDGSIQAGIIPRKVP